jgi:hypothetical protein
MAMVRKQIYLDAQQDKKLKRLAKASGLTEAELVRRAVDDLDEADTTSAAARREAGERLLALMLERVERDSATAASDLPWSRADIYQGHPRRLDDDAWAEELAFMEARARSLPDGGSTEKWNREDSYDNKRSHLPG